MTPRTPESEALDAMLSSGRFARAYWLTRADHTLGDPDLLGALSEGARIESGWLVSGRPDPIPWQWSRRSGPAGRTMTGCSSAPRSSARVCSWTLSRRTSTSWSASFPPEGSPVGALMQRVRELCVHQNAKIRPEEVGVEAADAARAARLDQLASDAESFLQRVPHVRFQYAPADRAIQFVYRAGSEWHRLHTIVGGNQNHRLNEVLALVKLLNPVEVVGNLHDEDELSVLRQPLEGRARDKLVRHLHDTLALARDWSRLVAAAKEWQSGWEPDPVRGTHRCTRAAVAGSTEVPCSGQGAGAWSAPLIPFSETWRRDSRVVRPSNVPASRAISSSFLACPSKTTSSRRKAHLDDLRRAILEAEHSEPEPREVLTECLERQEYRRAREIIQVHELGDRAQWRVRASGKQESGPRSRPPWRRLKLQIEDAFLLGQLRDRRRHRRGVCARLHPQRPQAKRACLALLATPWKGSTGPRGLGRG